MPTQTPNYDFDLPTEGGDKDTWGGYLNGNWEAVDTLLKAMQDKIDALEKASYVPIGGLYFSSADNDPATTLGYGTWEEYASGRAIVGVGNAGGGIGSWYPGQELGSSYVILSEAELPPHNHIVDPPWGRYWTSEPFLFQSQRPLIASLVNIWGDEAYSTDTGVVSVSKLRDVGRDTGSVGEEYQINYNFTHDHYVDVDIPAFLSGGVGSGGAHNNIQESIGVYVWRRTA